MTEIPEGYSATVRSLHWIMALMIIGLMFPAGLLMGELPDGEIKNSLYELHKSFGVTIFVLAIIRFAVRALRGVPALPESLPAWQRAVARATHLALYGLIVLVPVLGYVGTSMCCSPVNYFWLLPLPLEFSGSMEQAEMVLGWHKAAVFLMGALLVLHIGAALWHGFVRRDGVLERMLFGRQRS